VFVDVPDGNISEGRSVCKLPCRQIFRTDWSNRLVGLHELRSRGIFTREFDYLFELPPGILPVEFGISVLPGLWRGYFLFKRWRIIVIGVF
jgi:hypothetical protein